MRLVVADSSPLNSLVWIEQVEILPALFRSQGCSAGGCADRAAADVLFASKGERDGARLGTQVNGLIGVILC